MAKKKGITIDKIGVLVKLSNGGTYQVALTKPQHDAVLSLLNVMHGTVKVIEKEITTIDLD